MKRFPKYLGNKTHSAILSRLDQPTLRYKFGYIDSFNTTNHSQVIAEKLRSHLCATTAVVDTARRVSGLGTYQPTQFASCLRSETTEGAMDLSVLARYM